MDADSIVTAIEKERSVRAIQSEEKGLYYLEDDEKKRLGIMAVFKEKVSCVVLKKKQVETLIRELQDIYDAVFG